MDKYLTIHLSLSLSVLARQKELLVDHVLPSNLN